MFPMVNFLILSMFLLMMVYIGLSVSSLIILVLVMEVTMFIFIFQTYDFKMLAYSSPSVKYFLVQTIGSLVLLLYALVQDIIHYNLISDTMVLFALCLKLGMFPLHFWVIPMVMNLPFIMVGVLSVPMKILPLGYLFNLLHSDMILKLENFILFMGSGSMLVGMLLGLENNMIRGVLGASSITHTGWMMFGMFSGTLITYFILYSVVLTFLLMGLISLNGVIVGINFYALGGLPPFPVFFGKMMVLYNMFMLNMPLVYLVLGLLTAGLSLYYYLKFANSFLLTIGKNIDHF